MVKRFTARSFDDARRHPGNDTAGEPEHRVKTKPQVANGGPVKFSDESGLLQDPFEIDAGVLRAAADEVPRQKRTTALQRFWGQNKNCSPRHANIERSANTRD
jgi:hypothetical protein